MSAFRAVVGDHAKHVNSYTQAAMERAMEVQEMMLQAISTWMER
ncbi:MAG TPA: hypothetical protein VNO32_60290 [Candidatus Acidoferrum sp.]|nr:hypothetical protein [Candidatus Acidoferrum sp.]